MVYNWATLEILPCFFLIKMCVSASRRVKQKYKIWTVYYNSILTLLLRCSGKTGMLSVAHRFVYQSYKSAGFSHQYEHGSGGIRSASIWSLCTKRCWGMQADEDSWVQVIRRLPFPLLTSGYPPLRSRTHQWIQTCIMCTWFESKDFKWKAKQ